MTSENSTLSAYAYFEQMTDEHENTSDKFEELDQVYSDFKFINYTFYSLWMFLSITGFIGSGLVVITIINSRKLKNVTECYLVNLAISDMSFILSCVPVTTLAFLMEDGWIFGTFLCKTLHYMTFVTVCATCLTLTMMTVDRYIYICNTKKPSWRTPIYVFYVVLLIWMISLLLSIPRLIMYDVVENKYTNRINSSFIETIAVNECVQTSDEFLVNVMHWYQLALSYLIPSTVLIICYIKIIIYMSKNARRLAENSLYNGRVSIQRKRTVTKTVIFMTLTFIILWFPVNMLATWYKLDANFNKNVYVFVFKLIAHTMSYANPTLNPIIYGFLNKSFRQNIFNLFSCLSKKVFYRSNAGSIKHHLNNSNNNNKKKEKTFLPENTTLL